MKNIFMEIKWSDITCERSDFLGVLSEWGFSVDKNTDSDSVRKIKVLTRYFAKKYSVALWEDFHPIMLLEAMKQSDDLADRGLAREIEEILWYNNWLESHYFKALNASSMVLKVSPEWKVLWANEKFLEKVWLSLEKVIWLETRQLSWWVQRDEWEEYWKNLWKTIKSWKIWQWVIKNKSPSWDIYWTQTTIIPKITAWEVEFYTVVRNDVTDRELLKQNFDRLAQFSEEMLLENTELSLKSERDHLTWLHNRRFFDERLSEEISRSLRGDGPINLVLFDVDYFKKINDTYWHDGWDRVLKAIAEKLNKITREEDLKFRIGWEEFALILSWNLNLEEVKKTLEKIRKSFEEMELDGWIKFTISFWVAFFDNLWEFLKWVEEKDERREMIMKQADKALYQAKRDWRNCVRINRDL